MTSEVHLVPMEEIPIRNRRRLNHKLFDIMLQSVTETGRIEPIQVYLRWQSKNNESTYRLVAGQARIEACIQLGIGVIPAVIHTL